MMTLQHVLDTAITRTQYGAGTALKVQPHHGEVRGQPLAPEIRTGGIERVALNAVPQTAPTVEGDVVRFRSDRGRRRARGGPSDSYRNCMAPTLRK